MILAYFIVASIFLALLRFHPEGMEEDLLADALVATVWGLVLLFVCTATFLDRRPAPSGGA